jgi:hypothetical protein
VRSPPPIDPLEAADLLAEEISGAGEGQISGLIRAIDAFVYSLHFIDPELPAIDPADAEPQRPDYRQVYETIKHRYKTLSLYWVALHPVMQQGMEGEAAVCDAIDDLTDIVVELSDVRNYITRGDRKLALAALRARYDMRLWMHVHSLRQYLEEVKRDD